MDSTNSEKSKTPTGSADRPTRQPQLRIALAGNPNSGKTSLFNALTGANQKVGNWSGVTVEIKEGRARHGDTTVTIVDLPGTYSLSTCSPEEQVARDFIVQEKPDAVIGVVDATNLDRHLYLAIQMLELGIRPVLAFNMWDEVQSRGLTIDTTLLSRLLGVTIVTTNGRTGEGIRDLLAAAVNAHNEASAPPRPFSLTLPVEFEAALNRLQTALGPVVNDLPFPPRWIALQLLERDCRITSLVSATPQGAPVITLRDTILTELSTILGEGPETLIAEARYGFIAGAIKEAVKKTLPDRVDLSEKIDTIVTHRFWAYPIFLAFMWLLFQATFRLGEHPMGWIESLFGLLGSVAGASLPAGTLRDLLVDGVLAGVGGVIIFLPNILILFLGISIMEDTGYMARAAFITDKLMHRIGLHGKSFIPMLMGLGCSVPAIMAARTLESRSDRIKTILLTPLISCSARLPVFVLFAAAFFPRHAGNVVFLFQIVFSFGAFILMAVLFKHTLFRNSEDYPFVMELPPYRLPTLRSILIHMWQKTRHYLEKMGGVVLVFSVILWWAGTNPHAADVATEFDQRIAQLQAEAPGEPDERITLLENEKHAALMERTWIGRIGKLAEPVVRPFGSDWRGAVSLVTGFVAKEIVVGSMGVLYAVGSDTNAESEGLRVTLRNYFTPLSAFAFMLFVLLYTPCLVAFITVIRELRNWRWSLFSVGYQLVFAWGAATLVYQAGRLIGL